MTFSFEWPTIMILEAPRILAMQAARRAIVPVPMIVTTSPCFILARFKAWLATVAGSHSAAV